MSFALKYKLAATAAVSVLLAGASALPVRAADLGGDCCADLEERVAELEATTVRKGNRNVSVTLYGHVNSAVLWYDNGEEADAYVVDNDTSVSRIGVKGSGKIKAGWEAGYRIELQAAGDVLSGTSENDGDDGSGGGSSIDGVRVRQANWYVKSDQLGKVTVGQISSAADGIVDGIGLSGPAAEFAYDGPADWNASFCVIDASTGACSGKKWGDIHNAFDPNSRDSGIRYDTPAFAGFTISASWGEDDEADVAVRYEGDYGDVKVAAAAGYNYDADENAKRDNWAASASIRHVPTGIFVVASYGAQDRNVVGEDERTNWYLQGGVSKDFSGMGETAVYGEYDESDNADGAESEATMWGLGVAQDISAVGATAYLGYRHHEADIIGLDTKDFDAVLGGMKVRF
ncbi:MAG: porin [Hyphomicrobiaceae bacterium]